jgi:flagellar biosynthesis protein FlhF
MVKARLARMIESEVRVAGPIQTPPGHCRLVALVGPTGVGKTTTIAKLAANYRLKEKRRVGLITVDTYRIAAVEQLRTYADIIDLPMQVVSTPREMREAVSRMDDLDLILLDTAGRSPKDEVRIQELRAFLTEADADEVHLVLSSVAGARVLEQTAERFTAVGATALLLTKLDECSGLGNVLPLIRSSELPLSYLTNGQNVPDDIEVADSMRVARLILGMEAN